jgi:acyl-CoA reductase-like NAD-dependent aldehyde dehydrogenase
VRCIEQAGRQGAELVLGGPPSEEQTRRQYVQPTVFTGVAPTSDLFREEVFGPVLGVTSFGDEAEAIRLANAVPYGLAAGLWTQDVTRVHRAARSVQAGTVWVNGYRLTLPHSPFGGYKASGLGREGGKAAMSEYLQVKSVFLNLSPSQDPKRYGEAKSNED